MQMSRSVSMPPTVRSSSAIESTLATCRQLAKCRAPVKYNPAGTSNILIVTAHQAASPHHHPMLALALQPFRPPDHATWRLSEAAVNSALLHAACS
jgi:hypothetical protein